MFFQPDDLSLWRGGIRESGELGMGGGRDDVGGKGGGVFKMGKSLCIFKRINSATGE